MNHATYCIQYFDKMKMYLLPKYNFHIGFIIYIDKMISENKMNVPDFYCENEKKIMIIKFIYVLLRKILLLCENVNLQFIFSIFRL